MSAPPASLAAGDYVFLVDGSSFIFRAYFQSINQDQKYNTRPSDGMPTGALRLFCTKLLQFLIDGAAGLKPTHLGIVFDKEATQRKELYADYKGQRTDAPDELKVQMPLMREAVRAFGLLPVELQGYEADDLIATYARQAEASGACALIVSSDKDLMQLVGERVRFYDFESGARGKPGYRPERNLDREAVIERWEGIPPEKIGDVLALMGDASDNIPGVPGIGLKTAAQLIAEFGDLETLLARAEEIKQPKRRETLLANIDQARLSKRLVTLDEQVPVPVPLGELKLASLDPKPLIAFLKAMEFSTIARRVAALYDIDPLSVRPDPRLLPGGEGIRWTRPSAEGSPAAEGAPGPAASPDGAAAASPTPLTLVTSRAGEATRPFPVESYETIASRERLDAWLSEAGEIGFLALRLETVAPDPLRREIVGISLALAPGRAAYLPLGHRGDANLFGGGLLPGQMTLAEALEALGPVLADRAVLKLGHDVKADFGLLGAENCEIRAFDDVMLISYVLDAGLGAHALEELGRRHLGHQPIMLADIVGSGRAKVSLDQVAIERATAYAAEKADVLIRLWRLLKPRLVAERRASVYELLERPLVPVLARMEARGIAVDRNILSRLSGDFSQTLARLEDEIYDMAGERFLLGSPKQMGDILFGKMGLPGAKKTPTGQWATPATLLEELAEQGHALPAKMLEWRQLQKLKSTYTDSLPAYMDGNGRVHTSYALAATTTGRLSSSEPNLQNIPIRTEAGRKIRTAFVAEPGQKIISADYSQIELRLLAHIAEIPQLRQAFSDGIDIHAATASAMFGVPLAELNPDLRRSAKTINFGIIYGISAFGLAQRLGIGHGEAASFIKQYFERFPGIRDYMDETKRACRENGFVTTLFGRVCHYPQITSRNPSERAGVERQAINAPIQGSAADIIRRAMTRMERALDLAGLSSVRMLLQVHDELVFEAPEGEVEAALPVIRKVMEEAPHPAVQLRVPLAVDARAASNWEEAH